MAQVPRVQDQGMRVCAVCARICEILCSDGFYWLKVETQAYVNAAAAPRVVLVCILTKELLLVAQEAHTRVWLLFFLGRSWNNVKLFSLEHE